MPFFRKGVEAAAAEMIIAPIPDSIYDTQHATVYDGSLQDLNDLIEPNSGWVLIDAVALNDSGEIIGTGTLNGVDAGFLLTPVPEPGVIGLIAVGGFLMIRPGGRGAKRQPRTVK